MELDTFPKKGLWAFTCSEDPSLGVVAFQLSFVEAAEGSLVFIKGKQEGGLLAVLIFCGVFWQQLRQGTSDLRCAPRSWLLRC